MRLNNFLWKQAKQDRLPVPPISLNELLETEPFELVYAYNSNGERVKTYNLELNTDQDQMIVVINCEDESPNLDYIKVEVKAGITKSGRFTEGHSLYSVVDIQVVRFILEMFDKFGMVGEQYNEYWEV